MSHLKNLIPLKDCREELDITRQTILKHSKKNPKLLKRFGRRVFVDTDEFHKMLETG